MLGRNNHFRPTTRHQTDGVLADRAGVENVREVTTQFLDELAAAHSVESRMLAARYHGTSLTTLARLALERNPHVRCSVAVNTSATDEILKVVLASELRHRPLYKMLHRGVRTHLLNSVAAHRATGLETLAALKTVTRKNSPAGRYAQERITLVATRERISRYKAEKAAEKAAAIAENVEAPAA